MKKKLYLFLSFLFFTLIPLSINAQTSQNYDKNLPIEITADKLEVKQKEELAIFSGNVEARQGEMILNAQSLTVYYANQNMNESSQTVSKIDAKGEVFFSSKNETAQSEEGMYDVEKGIIFLKGNVILTQGENILRGNSLLMNLTNGTNSMSGMSNNSGENSSEGRVKGLFHPKK